MNPKHYTFKHTHLNTIIIYIINVLKCIWIRLYFIITTWIVEVLETGDVLCSEPQTLHLMHTHLINTTIYIAALIKCIRIRLNFVLILFAASLSSSTTFISYSAYYSTNHSSEFTYIYNNSIIYINIFRWIVDASI